VTIPDNLFAHVAPLGWKHFALTGGYVWTNNNAAADFRLHAMFSLCLWIARLSVQFCTNRVTIPIKQHTLRRDAVAVAGLIDRRITTQHVTKRPAWHPEFRARYDEYQEDGAVRGINFSLEVAIECARRMLSAAHSPDGRGTAAVLLGFRIESGKIAEWRVTWDNMTILRA
jgi:hypothetical protein